MANMSAIASMLAQSGQNIGQQIGAPVASFGQGIGGMLTARREKQQEQALAQEAQKQLQQYANDPAQLNALGQKYATEGNDALSKVFFDAAKMAVAKETAGQQRGAQGGLMAITQAAARGVPLADLQEGVRSVLAQGGTQADIMQAYKAGRPETKTPQYDYSQETVVIDGKPTRIQVGVNKADPTDRQVTTLGEAPPTGEGARKRTLAEQLEDAGVPDVDLTTIEGAKKAQRDIITITGNASLANSVGQIIEDLTPLPTKEAFDLIRSARPEFSTAESLREQTSRFAALSELSDQDVAGLSALVERTLTATTENDIKAVSELERFRKAKDLPQRIKDFALELTAGRLSEETMSEYTLIVEALDALASKRMADAIDNVITYGTPKEVEAAKRVRNMTFGPSSARILN